MVTSIICYSVMVVIGIISIAIFIKTTKDMVDYGKELWNENRRK